MAATSRRSAKIFWQIGFITLIVFLFFSGLEALFRLFSIGAGVVHEDPFIYFEGQSTVFMPDPAKPEEIITNPTYTALAAKYRDVIKDHRFSRQKGANEFRIFFLGGSSVHQLDESQLEQMLKKRYPDVHFRIINAGMAAYASYRIVRLLGEVLEFNPDLILVYCGHNEFLEERLYRSVIGTSQFVLKTRLFLHKFYLYGWLRQTFRDAKQATVGFYRPEEKKALSDRSKIHLAKDFLISNYAVRADPSEAAAVWEHYRYNLDRMLDMAEEKNLPLLLGKVAYNMETFPFAWESGEKYLHPDDFQRFSKYMRDGEIYFYQPNYEKALSSFLLANDLFDRNAVVRYYLGITAYRLGQFSVAYEHLLKAKEYDYSPGSATPVSNAKVMEVCRDHNLPPVDVVATFEAAVSTKIPGYGNLFVDQCHANEAGRQLILQTYFERIISDGIVEKWQAAKTGPESGD
jgi:hypothetical protein